MLCPHKKRGATHTSGQSESVRVSSGRPHTRSRHWQGRDDHQLCCAIGCATPLSTLITHGNFGGCAGARCGTVGVGREVICGRQVVVVVVDVAVVVVSLSRDARDSLLCIHVPNTAHSTHSPFHGVRVCVIFVRTRKYSRLSPTNSLRLSTPQRCHTPHKCCRNV